MKTRGLPGFLSMLLMASFTNPFPIHFRGMNYTVSGYNPIYTPRRKRFKGYMRENRRFNSFKKKIA